MAGTKLKGDMQNSNRNEKIRTNSSVVVRVCPQCGSEKPRRSSRHSSDGLLKKVFCKSYRCPECQYRFWEINPFRIMILAGILLVLIPVFGALWMATHKQAVVVNYAEPVFNDQIKNLAEKGDADAELKMGLRYTPNAKGGKDVKIAVQWYEKAARHGQVEAQYRYGLALLEGRGVVQDYKTAFYWLEKAAQLGQPQAQATLGEIYNSGIAIPRDIERAYLWFNLAAAQGVEDAASSRDLVVKLLTPNQIAAMQEEAIRISRGYRSSYVVDEPKAALEESHPLDIDSPPADEPKVKSVIPMLKDWLKKQL